MKDGASRKKPSPRDIRAHKRAQGKDPFRSEIKQPMSNEENPLKMVVAPPNQESLDSACKRTEVHPMHVISTAISPDPLETWPEKQDVNDIKDMIRLTPDQMKKGYPSSLIIIRDDQSRDRILVPKCQRLRLVVKEHETMLHESGRRVHHELVRKYYWPNMANQIKTICKACQSCQTAKVRRQHLSAAFELAAKEDLPLPRQAYGIDFYGHTHGEILVALDLCTREVSLWFLPDRKMEGVAKALLSGLIFQKGVPLIFVNDEAKEFVDGTVQSMNRYLGIKQITTGGHNPRSNANVERFMQHLTSCLTKCDDTQYRNLKVYIQAIAFAHNTAFNSAINCTPFEAGHGLRARTITEARASPRLQITAEEGTDLQEPDKDKWESTIFYKVCKLAERLAEDAQRQSQWHKRMNAHNLNQAGKVISDKPLEQGSKVYFYRPPSQQEVIQRGRKAKHLMHYRGPANIIGNVVGRKRQYEFEYNGKRYKRDISMLIPEQTMLEIDVTTLDVTDSRESGAKPKLHVNGDEIREEDLILCKTELTDTEWYLAEINKIYSDEIEVVYFTTPAKSAENYIERSFDEKSENLRSARFRKTWIIRDGKNAGRGTLKVPFPSNPELRIWKGRLPKSELNELILATNIKLSPQGYLSKDSIDIACKLPISFGSYETIEDEQDHLNSLRQANALFTYAQRTLCTCAQCALCFTQKQ
jgi:transposase InsO family protein